MGERALKKWEAVRALYEVWGAPIDLLCDACGVRLETLQERKVHGQWKQRDPAAAVYSRLSQVLLHQIEQLNEMNEPENSDKHARALSLMSKSLESLATLGVRYGINIGEENSNHHAGSSQPSTIAGPQRTFALDQKLARFLEEFGEEGAC